MGKKLLIGLALVCVACSPSNAINEATVTGCAKPDLVGAQYVKGTVTNSTSKRSDYTIDVAVDAPNGTQIGTGSESVVNVEPGQKAVWEALTNTSRTDWTVGAKCSIVKVDRTEAT